MGIEKTLISQTGLKVTKDFTLKTKKTVVLKRKHQKKTKIMEKFFDKTHGTEKPKGVSSTFASIKNLGLVRDSSPSTPVSQASSSGPEIRVNHWDKRRGSL